jgi:hypothetical protein
MARPLGPNFAAAIEQDVVEPVYFVRLDFPSDVVRLWTGIGTKTMNSEVYQGVGGLVNIGAVVEPSTPTIASTSITLNGLSTTYLALVLGEHFQLRPAAIYIGALDENGDLEDDPCYLYFSGVMNTGKIKVNPETGTIGISLDGDLADIKRTRERRYNDEDQQIDFPGDKGFEYATAISPDRQILWGKVAVRMDPPVIQDNTYEDYTYGSQP